MHRGMWINCWVLVGACASADATDGAFGGSGKADGPGEVPDHGTWSREVVSDSATLWNGGPVEWGAGTSIAVRADGRPMIAYYDASYRCNNAGNGTYSPDALMIARRAASWAS